MHGSVIRVSLALLATFAIFETRYAAGSDEAGSVKSARVRVVVVGAGVAGFTAAATLLASNVTDLVVLEAADRVGGRIHTVQFGGVAVDRGAEFCHGEGSNPVFQLASPLGLLTPYNQYLGDDSAFVANTSGHIFNSSFINNVIKNLESIYEEDEMENVNGSSVADYFFPRMKTILESLEVDEYVSEAMHHLGPLLETVTSGSDDLQQLGARGFVQYQETGGDQYLKWKNGTGGYSTLFDLISKKNQSGELPVRSKILLGKKVTSIDKVNSEVEVACEDGSRYVADHVIVTLGLGVLKAHSKQIFKQPLPDNKATAIETVGIGCVVKVFMLFPIRWWPQEINVFMPLFSQKELHDFKNTTVYGSWSSWTGGFFPVIQHERMLCAWFTGDACRTVEGLTDQQLTDGLMELLSKMVANTSFTVTAPEALLRTNWASNPYTLGAYSFNTVDSDEHNVTRDNLAEPLLTENKPVVLFAGEATHEHYFSTVHGALESGRREAERLISYFTRQAA